MKYCKFNKKSLISLEALIILIAIIVIAAIAASVILQQSGLLSQRAIAVGDQSRERIVTGFEVISVSGQANISAETLNDIELLVRLKPGSLPIQLKNLKILYTTSNIASGMSLQHTDATDLFSDINITGTTTSWMNVSDIEDNILEATAASQLEAVRYDAVSDNLQINLSWASNNADPDDENSQAGHVANISIGDLSSAGTTPVPISIIDEPITINGVVYGFVTVTGSATVDDSLTGTYARIINVPSTDICYYTHIIHEERFCFVNKIGNGDTTLDHGEVIGLRFRLKPYNVLSVGTIYEIQMLPKEGAITTVQAVSPSTLVVENTKMWG